MVYYLAKKLCKEYLIMEKKNSNAFDSIQNDLTNEKYHLCNYSRPLHILVYMCSCRIL